MKLPRLPITSSNSLIKAENFGGLNETDSHVFGELSDCKNMTSDNYPALASRKGRFIAPIMGKGKVLGCGSSEEFYYVYNDVVNETAEDGTVTEKRMSYFVYGGVVKGEWEDADAKEKNFAEIGRYICIYPDLMYYRREDTDGIAEYKKTMSTNKYNVGRDYKNGSVIDEDEERNVQVTMDSRRFLNYIKPLPIDFTGKSVKITNGAFGIEETEVLKVTQCNVASENDNYPYRMQFDGWIFETIFRCVVIIQEVVPEEYYEKFGSFKSKAVASGRLGNVTLNYKEAYGFSDFESGMEIEVTEGILKGKYIFRALGIRVSTTIGTDSEGEKGFVVTTDKGTLEGCNIELSYPDLTYVCCSNNRLWGAGSGTIYASALGNPRVFSRNNGTEADSWTVDVLSNGDFTAVFEYAGMPHFAKKDRIIKVYGSSPSTYQTSETLCDGVLDCRSVAFGSGVMYWLSENGVMTYTGAYPVKISEKLGSVIVSGIGVAGGIKYYLYATLLDGGKKLYVYDREKAMWHCEECEIVTSAVCHDGKIYATAVNENSDCSINVLHGTELLTEEEKKKYNFARECDVNAHFTMSDNYENTYYHKYISKLIFRVQAEKNAYIRFYLRYDNDEQKVLYYEYTGKEYRDNIYIPIIPRRCDRYELYVEGRGEWKIISIARELSGGSTKKNIER